MTAQDVAEAKATRCVCGHFKATHKRVTRERFACEDCDCQDYALAGAPTEAWARKDLLASCQLLVNAQTTTPFPPPTMQITPTHAKEILAMAEELSASGSSLSRRSRRFESGWGASPGDELPGAQGGTASQVPHNVDAHAAAKDQSSTNQAEPEGGASQEVPPVVPLSVQAGER